MGIRVENLTTGPQHISNPSIQLQDIEFLGAVDAKIASCKSSCFALNSCRWILAYVCFGAMILVFGMRASFVMALVCLFPEEPDVEAELALNSQRDMAISAFELLHNTSGSDGQSRTWLNITSLLCNESLLFAWDDKTQGLALSAYNYGFVISPIIGGYIATHSAKYVLLVSMFVSTVATLLTPWSIGTNAYFAVTLRIVIGLCGGVCVPAIQDLWSKWAPREERGKLTAFTHSGKMIGNALTFSLTGVFCTVKYLGGWPIIFYGMGVFSVIWMILAIIVVYDSPEKHPRITEEERAYILRGTTGIRTTDEAKIKTKTPWTKMAMSLPLWACLICKLCSAYGIAVQTTNMPMWVRDVLKFEIQENGLFSALPYVGQFVGSLLAGIMLDALNHTPFSVTVVRKVTFTICLLLPGSAIFSLAFLDYQHRTLAICLTVVASTTYAAVPVSLRIVIIEMAPKYAGILMGMTVTIGSIPGMFAPLVTSVITSRGTTDEWHNVFYMCGGFYALAAVVFLIFGSAKEQPWAHGKVSQEITVEAKNEADNGTNEAIEKKGSVSGKAQHWTECDISIIIEENKRDINNIVKTGFQEEQAASNTSTDSGIAMVLCLEDVGNVDNITLLNELNSSNDVNETIHGIANQCFIGENMESCLCTKDTAPSIRASEVSVNEERVAVEISEKQVNRIDIRLRENGPTELPMNDLEGKERLHEDSSRHKIHSGTTSLYCVHTVIVIGQNPSNGFLTEDTKITADNFDITSDCSQSMCYIADTQHEDTVENTAL